MAFKKSQPFFSINTFAFKYLKEKFLIVYCVIYRYSILVTSQLMSHFYILRRVRFFSL